MIVLKKCLLNVVFFSTTFAIVIPSHGQLKNYISFGAGYNNAIGKFASSSSVNSTGLLTSLINPQAENSGASLLLPATNGGIYTIDGGYYFYKFLGIAANASYSELSVDPSALQNSLGDLISKGSALVLPLATQGQTPQIQALLAQTKFSASFKSTNWNIYTFHVGPTVGLNSGKFTMDFAVKGGITSYASPKVITGLDYAAPFVFGTINGTILEFSQASTSKVLFSYQVGYQIRYQLIENISLKLAANLTSTFNNDVEIKVKTESPSLGQLQLLAGAGGQNFNITLPVDQKSTVNTSISTLNISIGINYEFGSIGKKKIIQQENDNELIKQQ